VLRAYVCEGLTKAGVPIEYRSPSIERERLDVSKHTFSLIVVRDGNRERIERADSGRI
jgi:hypothetical protein